LALIACLAGPGRPAIAQEKTQTVLTLPAFVPSRPVDVGGRLLFVEELSRFGQPPRPRSSRDTVMNGALIGALIGAVGLGAFGAFICHLHQEEGGASCLRDTMRVGAIGAAIGMGAGVAVDAALTSNAGVTVRIRVDF
jgi:hypothetical protein